jgi:enoyl-CoA hydratase
MAWNGFTLTVENRIAHLTLSRPEKRNALTRAFLQDLPAAIRELDDSGRARVLVVSSTGPYFSSGIDTAMFGAFAPAADGIDGARRARLTEPLARYEGISAMQRAFSALEQCRIPVIAAVQGGCIGAGLDLVSACCMRYASADAFFSIYEIHLGMPADLGTFPRLARHVPEGMVRELAYTGRRMGVAEARERGFVNEVFASQAEMLAGVAQVAKEIAAKAPLALMGTKRLITYGRDHSTADTLDQVALWIGGLVSTDQVKEAASARAERREPEFASLPPRL